MKPIMLSLWGQFGPNEGSAFANMSSPFPIVIGMRLKATQYNGLTLSTKSATTFILNPPLPQAHALLTWCVAHGQTIKTIPLNKVHQVGVTQSPAPTANKVIPICQLPTCINQASYYWIEASTSVENFNQKLWFMCFSKCNKSTGAGPDDMFQCNYCKEKVQAEPRCKFDVQLQDSSGEITATIFGTQAEKLFSINARKCMQSTSIDGDLSLEAQETLRTTEAQIIQLRAYPFRTAATTCCKFNINAVHKVCSPTIEHSTSETISSPPSKKACRELYDKEATSSQTEENSNGLNFIANNPSTVTNKQRGKKKTN